MKEIGVAQISSNNPMIKNYLKTINFWDKEGNFTETLNNNEIVKPFFCVYYDDMFLGASTLIIDPTSMVVDIHMIIGSTGHKKEIEEFFAEHLKNIALTQYGATSVVFNGQKEKETQKLLAK